jgi:hypothetical protein
MSLRGRSHVIGGQEKGKLRWWWGAGGFGKFLAEKIIKDIQQVYLAGMSRSVFSGKGTARSSSCSSTTAWWRHNNRGCGKKDGNRVSGEGACAKGWVQTEVEREQGDLCAPLVCSGL